MRYVNTFSKTSRPTLRRHLIISLTTFGLAGGTVIGVPALSASASVKGHVRSSKARSIPKASDLLAKMKHATNMQSSVRLTIQASQGAPKLNETVTVDSSRNSGRQTAVSGKERANVLLTTSGAYLSGNSLGLTAFFALPKDDLALVGTKWISIKPGTTQYKSFVSAITVKNLLANLLPTSKSLSVRATTYKSEPTYEIDWSISSSGTTTKLTLTVPRTGRVLPLAESASTGKTVEHSYLTNWGERINVQAPKNTIAITKLHPT